MYWLIFHAGTAADSLGLPDDRFALLFRQEVASPAHTAVR
jgi:hypothetical protein